MKTYLINLDRSTDRLSWFMEQAVALGLDVVRIPAVEGTTISSSEQLRYDSISLDHRVLSPARTGLPDEPSGGLAPHCRSRRPVELRCRGRPPYQQATSEFLAGSGWIPSGSDIVKAETILDPVTLSNQDIDAPGGRKLKGLRSFHAGSAGYFISKDAAKVLLAFAEIHCEPADHFSSGQPAHASMACASRSSTRPSASRISCSTPEAAKLALKAR